MIALLALTLALQQPTAPAPATPAAPAPPPVQAPVRRPAPSSSTVQVHVTDRSGAPQQGVQVTAEGPVSRDGTTDATGNVQFRTMTNGTYRVRAAHDSFVTLEKEVTVRGGATTAPIEFALNAAPAPPPPPPPAPAPQAAPPPAPVGTSGSSDVSPGDPRVLSVADLAERSLSGRDPMKLVPIGCSGADNTQMIVLRETLNAPANPNVDEMLYVVAGEAMLTMAGRDQTVTSGWFVLVPRGVPHTLTKRGRNPVILLSTTGGQRCGGGGSR
jgi:mannose-6-phosphate isomerase-like protein (cupin superfamily)